MSQTAFAYFPGCSAHSTGREYDFTTRQVFTLLGAELKEIPDWNCCGASSAHAVNDRLDIALSGRNIAKAEALGLDVVVPCAACFNRLAHAALALPAMTAHGGGGLPRFEGNIKIMHPMLPLSTPQMLGRIAGLMQQDLAGLKVVPYYGCLTVRPMEVTGADGRELEDPSSMDKILEVLGADVRRWSHKTVCCGAGQALQHEDIVQSLSMNVVSGALEAGAEAIVTGCPLCFLNLETQQLAASGDQECQRVPVFYFTELMALCFGVTKIKKTLGRHLIPVDETLSSRRVAI